MRKIEGEKIMECYLCGENLKKEDFIDNHHPNKKNKPNWTKPTHHICHLIHHNIYPKNYNILRQLVEAKKSYQKKRIEISHQILALKKLGLKPSKTDEEISKLILKKEHDITEEYMEIVRCLTLWKDWSKAVYGLGENLFGQLIAYISDISRFEKISNLWSYFGYGLYDDKIQSLKTGYKHNFDCRKRSLMFNIVNCFIKHNQKSYYGKLYYKFKQKYKEKYPEPISNNNGNGFKQNYTDMHIHLMSIRKVSKVFLKDLWIVWRTLEDLPISQPYEVEYLGCKQYQIPYFNHTSAETHMQCVKQNGE